jgi:hypothetical protein
MATQAQIDLLVNTAGTGNSLRDFRQQIQQIQQAISTATNPADVARLQGALAQARDAAVDFRERLSALGENRFETATRGIQSIAAGFQTAQAAANLFGAESAQVEEALLRIQSAMALTEGLGQLAEAPRILRNVAEAFGLIAPAANAAATAQAAQTTAATAGAAAQTANATATTAATTATTAFGTALKLAGIGLVVSAVAALVMNFDKITEAVGKATGGTDKLKQTFSGVASAAMELGKTVLIGLATPVRVLYNLITGDLKGAWNAVKETVSAVTNGVDNVTKVYSSGVAEKAQQQALEKQIKNAELAASRMKKGSLEQLNEEVRILKLKIQLAKNNGEETEALETQLIQKRQEIADAAAKRRLAGIQKNIEDEQEAFRKLFGDKGVEKLPSIPLPVSPKLEIDTSGTQKYKDDLSKAITKIDEDVIKEKAEKTADNKEAIKKLFPFLDDKKVSEMAKLSGDALKKAIDDVQGDVNRLRSFFDSVGIGKNIQDIIFGGEDFFKGMTPGEKAGYIAGALKEIGASVVSVLSQISEVRLQNLENDKLIELETLNQQEQERLQSVAKGSAEEQRLRESFSKKREDVERNYAKKEREIRKENALFEADIRIFNVIANTAAAIASSLATPFLIPFISSVGLVQLGVAIAQRDAISKQKAAKGGMLVGPSHSQGGITGTGVFNNIEVEGGEFIVNKEATRRNLPLLNAINRSNFEPNATPVASNPLSDVTETIASMLDRPLKAYVVEQEIQDVRTKREYLERRTTI